MRFLCRQWQSFVEVMSLGQPGSPGVLLRPFVAPFHRGAQSPPTWGPPSPRWSPFYDATRYKQSSSMLSPELRLWFPVVSDLIGAFRGWKTRRDTANVVHGRVFSTNVEKANSIRRHRRGHRREAVLFYRDASRGEVCAQLLNHPTRTFNDM